MKSQFPIAKEKINGHPLIYLDSAATSLTPTCVQEEMMKFYNEYNANVHRSSSTLAKKATEVFEQARITVANFIGAQSEEILFTRNTTEGINLIARILTEKLDVGDEIILSIAEHHSNLVVWQQLAKKKGAIVKFIHVDADGALDMQHAKDIIGEKTKILAITHASNVLGILNPINELARLAHDNDALIIVDGAQTVGHLPVHVKDLEIDFLAFSGHKMCGPTGIGVVYGDKELLEALPPFFYGGEMIDTVTKEESTWNTLPWKFEAGTPNIAGAIGLAKAMDYLNEQNLHNIHKTISKLTSYTIQELEKIPGVTIYGKAENDLKLGVISLSIDGLHTLDLAALLDNYGIQVREGNHCAQPLMNYFKVKGLLRISLYIYNTQEDIDFFIKTLKQIIIRLSGKIEGEST